MSANRFFATFALVSVAVMILAACGGASAPQSVSSQTAAPPANTSGPAASTPTTAPPANTSAPEASTPTTAPAAIVSLAFEGLSSGLDNATQARIRTVSEVMGAPMTDVYVNGMPAFDGGIAQQNIDAGKVSGWLYVTPGTYSIALVPHGGTIDQALFAPVDVKAEAGHRYTVAAIGQLADKDVHPLVVDETTLESGLGAGPTDTKTIDINNLTGADSITEYAYGKITADNIKYGEARAWFNASGTVPFKTVANAKTPGVLFDDTDRAEPATSYVIPWFGPYPAADYKSVGNISQGTSDLNVLDFLAGFDGRNVKMDGHLATFNTLLSAIDKAGLHNQLVNSGPYFLLAPTDEAFAAMPKDQRDALLNDPQALTKLLNAHLVDGYYPYGSLSGLIYGYAERILTNRLGLRLSFHEDAINDIPAGPNYTVGNGDRVQIVYTLLPTK